MEDTRISKPEALNMLLGRYQSQRCLEEANKSPDYYK
jgi:hypothetical protein